MRGLIRGGGATGAGRDLRVDAFRGLALWFILIDHIPGNRLGELTLRNIALCDATEAFVLLAGYAAGLAYGATLDRRGWPFAVAALLRRAGTLYIAHIFLFVVFTAQVGYSAAALESSAYLDELHLDAFGEQPYWPCCRRCCCVPAGLPRHIAAVHRAAAAAGPGVAAAAPAVTADGASGAVYSWSGCWT